MASGKKNYFRHSFFARKHSDIAGMIEDHGKEAYFHFFALVELCAEQASDSFPVDSKFTFRRSTVCRELLVTNSRLGRHLLVTVPSLVDDIVVTEKEVEILFPKLRKYMGKYDSKSSSNSSKESKEKEKKVKEIEAPKKNLPKVKPKAKPKTPLFEVEPTQLDEELSINQTASNALTLLNALTFSAFRPVPSNMKFINARLNEGYSLEDFKLVIEFKQRQWASDPKMKGYLRPETLFGTKFDGYLQESQNAAKPIVDPLDAFFEQYAPVQNEGA